MPAAAVCGRLCFATCITMQRARARERVLANSGTCRGPGATRGPKSTSSRRCALFERLASLFPRGALLEPRECNSGEYTVRCEKPERCIAPDDAASSIARTRQRMHIAQSSGDRRTVISKVEKLMGAGGREQGMRQKVAFS